MTFFFACVDDQAATTYAQLLNTQSDNNVKLIVLERLAGLKKHHAKVSQTRAEVRGRGVGG